MTNPIGSFVWYELMTDAPDATREFYRSVIGWEISGPDPQVAGGPMDYRHIVRSDGGSAGGVLKLQPEMLAGGARPCWLPYLRVADVAAEVAAFVAEGGRVLMPAMTIEVGTFALLADPQGAPIYVMAPVAPPGREGHSSDVFSPTETQRVGWNEYFAEDLDAAKSFYARHFGFEFNNSMPMGPMGDYCFIDHHGQVLGAMMKRPPQAPAQGWRIYFRVPDTFAARDAVIACGGQVATEPQQVPGGDWIFQAFDPQGAFFGVVGRKAEDAP